MNFKINSDFHTHTKYSHGKGTIFDNFKIAKSKNLDYLAITDHGPEQIIAGIRKSDLAKMRDEIDYINDTSLSTKILLGLELNFTSLKGDIDYPIGYDLDIVVCGFHKAVALVRPNQLMGVFFDSYFKYIIPPSKKQIKNATKMYVNAIKKNKIDIISHIGRHVKVDVKEIAKACSDYGTYIEISSRHIDLSDDEYDILFNNTKANFVLNSDAHKPTEIGIISRGFQKIQEIGLDLTRIHNIDNRYINLRSKNHKNIRDLF